MTEFKHPPTPPAIPGEFVPVVAINYSTTYDYIDGPGCLRAAEDIVERRILDELTPRYGHDTAVRALAHVAWRRTYPNWPGDHVRVHASVRVHVLAGNPAQWAPVPPPAGLQSDTQVTDTEQVASPEMA